MCALILPFSRTYTTFFFLIRMTLEEGNLEFKTTPVQSPGKPMIHPCMDPPLCENCQRLDLSFFDPMCAGCKEILLNPATTVPEIFAILRQWTPQTQQNLELLVDEVCNFWAHFCWFILFFCLIFTLIFKRIGKEVINVHKGEKQLGKFSQEVKWAKQNCE